MTDSTLPPCRRMVILTEDRTTPFYAKTAMSLLKYRSADVLGLLDSTQAGQTAGALLGMGGDIPIVASLDDVDSPDNDVDLGGDDDLGVTRADDDEKEDT